MLLCRVVDASGCGVVRGLVHFCPRCFRQSQILRLQPTHAFAVCQHALAQSWTFLRLILSIIVKNCVAVVLTRAVVFQSDLDTFTTGWINSRLVASQTGVFNTVPTGQRKLESQGILVVREWSGEIPFWKSHGKWKIGATKCRIFWIKMHQIWFPLGLRPRPRRWSLQLMDQY